MEDKDKHLPEQPTHPASEEPIHQQQPKEGAEEQETAPELLPLDQSEETVQPPLRTEWPQPEAKPQKEPTGETGGLDLKVFHLKKRESKLAKCLKKADKKLRKLKKRQQVLKAKKKKKAKKKAKKAIEAKKAEHKSLRKALRNVREELKQAS